jgi:hypothetical protein
MSALRHLGGRRLLVAAALIAVPLRCTVPTSPAPSPQPPTQSPNCGTPQPHETNGSLEQPDVPTGQIDFFTSAQVPGWFGSPADALTVVRGPLNGEVAYDGAQMGIIRAANGLGVEGDSLTVGRQVAFSVALKALTLPTVVHIVAEHDGQMTELGAPTISNNGPDRNGWTLLTFTDAPISHTPMRFILTAPTATRGVFIDDAQIRPLASACDDLGSVDSGDSLDLRVLGNDLGTRLKITSAGGTIPASSLVVTRFDDHIHVDAPPGLTGTFAIPYTIIGGAGHVSQATATVVVNPKAVDDNVTVGISSGTTSIDVLANDLGPNKTIESVADPVHGTAVIVGDHIDYTTDRSYVGLESFHYAMLSNGVRSVATVNVTLERVSDLAVTAGSPVPATPIAGGTFMLPFTISTSGPSAATRPLLTFNLPPGVSFVSGDGCDGAPARCAMPVTALLASGGQTTFDPVFRSSVSGPIQIGATVSSLAVQLTVNLLSDDQNPANNTATGSVTVAPAADVRVANTSVTTHPVVPGSAITWAADVANDGPSVANSTQAVFSFPSSVSAVTASVAGTPAVTCTTASGSVACPFGDIPGGTLRHVTLSGHVAASATLNGLVFGSSVTSGVADPDPTNNDQLISAGALPQADLQVDASLTSPAPLQPGGAADYSIVTSNHGPAVAEGATLVVDLGDGLSVQTPPNGCTATAARVACRLGTLAAGSSRTTTVNASVVRNQGDVNKVLTATAAAATPDPSPANAVDTVTSPVNRTADVSVQFAPLGLVPAPPIVGVNTLMFAIVVNNGPSTATNVVTTMNVPTGFTLLDDHPACTGTGPVTCTVSSVPAGSIAVTDIYGQWQVPPGVPQTFSASTTAAQPDPTPANNTNTRDVTPIVAADLGISARIAQVPVGPNQANGYVLTVRNGGPSAVGAGSTVALQVSTAITIGALPAGCTRSATFINCTLGPIASADEATVTIPFTTGASVPAPLLAIAAVHPPNGITDLDPTNEQTQISSATFGVADIVVQPGFPTAFAAPGGTAAAVYTIANHGPDDISGAKFDVLMPRDWGFLSASGASCFQQGGNTAVHCQTAPLAAGDQVTVTVTVSVPVTPLPPPDQPLGDSLPGETENPTGPVVGPITNGSLEQLTVIANNPAFHDPDLTNGTATIDVTRLAAVDVALTATPPASVTVGSPATFTFKVANVGAGATTLNSLLITPPAGAAYKSSTGTTCTSSAVGINCPLPNLAVGASKTVTVTLDTNGVTGTDFHLFATAYTFGFDQDGTNNYVLLDVPIP